MPVDDKENELRNEGKVQVLEYLIGVAQRSQGGEVWRALFAEMRNGITGAVAKRPPVENRTIGMEEMRKHSTKQSAPVPDCGFAIG